MKVRRYINFESKIETLEQQLRQLKTANLNFAKENSEINSKLKDFQLYTNMVKAQKRPLKESDFSILEIMSKRAEDAEFLNLKLKLEIEKLQNEKEALSNKMRPMENYLMIMLKNESEMNPNNVLAYKEDELSVNVRNEIEKEVRGIMGSNEKLIEIILKLKTENIKLETQLRDVTVECNRILRKEASKLNV